MEPLNLMVSLSHFADDKREHKHGLSEPAGRGTGRRWTTRVRRSSKWVVRRVVRVQPGGHAADLRP